MSKTIRDALEPGETAGLLGAWWMIRREGESMPHRMIWAGGRELYEEAVAVAHEKFGMAPIEIPMNAFYPSDEPITMNPKEPRLRG